MYMMIFLKRPCYLVKSGLLVGTPRLGEMLYQFCRRMRLVSLRTRGYHHRSGSCCLPSLVVCRRKQGKWHSCTGQADYNWIGPLTKDIHTAWKSWGLVNHNCFQSTSSTSIELKTCHYPRGARITAILVALDWNSKQEFYTCWASWLEAIVID